MGEGNIAISLLNVYATVVVKVESQIILFDPIEVDPDSFAHLDSIVVTHEHVDHFDKKLVIEIQRKTKAKILIPSCTQDNINGMVTPIHMERRNQYVSNGCY